MKKIIKRLFSLAERLCLVASPRLSLKGSLCFLNRYAVGHGNCCALRDCALERNIFSISGEGNTITATDATINRSKMTIDGTNNRLTIERGVILRDATIIIRGSGNTVSIGAASSFGGVRIVNVGTDNAITIGRECLFSDRIEIWASDTHPLYDRDGLMINGERPIHIGDRVWVGCNVTVAKGVTIGDGAVVGMGTMVTADVAPRCVVVNDCSLRSVREEVSWKLHYDK
ncbi:hypothetical protein FACS1894159_06870 [Bacteroidia bacterium]|nr:hypothetical protein FACS1894159_06870 [Bacteroidia bacterium]